MKPASVSFVVVAKNEAQALGKCLSSIERLECSDCEVICVDSDSSDATFAIMKSFVHRLEGWRALRVPDCRNAAEARNAGKAAASCPWIFFIDGDIELHPDFLVFSAERTEVGHCGRCYRRFGRDHVQRRQFRSEIRTLSRIRYPETVRLMACGGNFVATREIVQSVGDFDVRFDRSQDLDFTLRLEFAGHTPGDPGLDRSSSHPGIQNASVGSREERLCSLPGHVGAQAPVP
jgi:glycosyltransferase involved in cell wall biosynthesis